MCVSWVGRVATSRLRGALNMNTFYVYHVQHHRPRFATSLETSLPAAFLALVVPALSASLAFVSFKGSRGMVPASFASVRSLQLGAGCQGMSRSGTSETPRLPFVLIIGKPGLIYYFK